ncbi:MAG: type I glyceraldehyde-3-phosphate dehydrogenase [Rhodobacteraceae bacterium]|nr:type I glyceraldehyde-3-phosphate dehydrogenase [Paracoccaceae bacterium]
MTVTVGINGFGRIGRNILRAIAESGRTDVRIVAVNDLAPVGHLAHLLEFDSVHGRFPGDIRTGSDFIDIGTGPIKVSATREPEALPWDGVAVAMECTGLFTKRAEAARHLNNGSARVLVSAPTSDADRTIVFGVNHTSVGAGDRVISNASCTTNCLAPVAKVLAESVGIERGFMTTIHSYTGDQPALDAVHKDLYRARAAAMSMIPTSTGAARAVGLVLPELNGRLDGVAIRVPTPNVSVVDLTFQASTETTVEAINDSIRSAAAGALRGILSFTDRPNVSMDFNHDPHSSIFHTDQTKVMNRTFCRILSWYDNEWGFSNRMADMAAYLAQF